MQRFLKVLKDSLNAAVNVGEKKYSYIRSSNEAIIFGQGKIWFYEGDDKLYPPEDYDIYIPTVTISKMPAGGGQSYESFNLLTPTFEESFYVSSAEADAVDFYMSFDDLASIDHVEVMDQNGDFVAQTVTTDYSVDLEHGKVTFVNPPGVSPVEGEDNIHIVASRKASQWTAYTSRITKCSFAIAFVSL